VIDTAWWERQEPETFLLFNWSHPSRVVATEWAGTQALLHGGELVEVGPGSGVDYARAFREMVLHGYIRYTGYEPTRAFHVSLQAAYPESSWVNAACDALAPGSADVVYARAVLEHQPALRPALDCLLHAARHAVVLDWYRPPAEVPTCDYVGAVPCQTYARGGVRSVIEHLGWTLAETHAVDGNEVWRLARA
jgi:hypothetical protein